jgi:predicted phage terminase large subunit-like protein
MLCKHLTREQSNNLYLEVLQANDTEALRKLAQEDLFFLLTVGCKRKDINHDWLYARCREVEAEPNGYLDLWAREHYKSSIITFGKSIQNILSDPNVTIGIFSQTRPIAKDFLKQIKTEFERNTFLKELFPDILYSEPEKQSPRWSLDQGIRVKRTDNPREETVEAWGLVDGQPTGKHFRGLIYDDVVTKESVTTPEQIKKTTEAWELSLSLGSQGGWARYIGTRYHLNDTYQVMMDRGSVKPRVYPAREGGTPEGRAVFMSEELLQVKRRDFGPYTFGSQMLQNPTSDKAMSFKKDWLKFYENILETKTWNKYLLVDPASAKKSSSDYTVMAVVGLAPDQNYYLLSAIRDRLNLTQRAAKLFEFHHEWTPKAVGYEKYGKDADIEHIQSEMEHRNYRFSITELGGSTPKADRIQGLIPKFEQGKFWLPKKLSFVDYEGRSVDFVQKFVDEEYTAYPVVAHDDMLDCLARILDPKLSAVFPKIQKPQPKSADNYMGSGGWMS